MKDERLQLRLDSVTRTLLDELARRQKMNVSEWIRSVILEYTSLKKDATTAKNHAEQLVKREKYLQQVEELLKRYEDEPKLTELYERYKGQIVEGVLIRHRIDLIHLMANQTIVELSKETEETTEILPTVQLKAVTPAIHSPSIINPISFYDNSDRVRTGLMIVIVLLFLTGAVFLWSYISKKLKLSNTHTQLPLSKEM